MDVKDNCCDRREFFNKFLRVSYFTLYSFNTLNLFLKRPDAIAKASSAHNARPLSKKSTKKRKITGLEDLIELNIKQKRKKGLLTRREKTGWSFRNLQTGEYLATINAETPMQCASMEKPFLAQLYLHEVKVGKKKYTHKAERMMILMLQKSNNYAANWFFRELGGPRRVERRLKKYYGRVYQHTHFVEHIPKGGRAYRNKVAPNDYSRFLYYLWHNKFPYSEKLKHMMRLPNNDRISKGLYRCNNDVCVYNKTGTTAMFCGDMGIVHISDGQGKTFTYSMAATIESSIIQAPYRKWARSRGRIISEISRIAYNYIVNKHL